MKYLFIIISLIILIITLHIYLNINEQTIEKFSPLPVPFLGPIEFRDKESKEKLGEYPENWESNNNLDNPENIEVTVVEIMRGPQGVPGVAGVPADVGICEGKIDIQSIDTNELDINVAEINMNADIINIKNKICIGDNCLDSDLINKIKTCKESSDKLKEDKDTIYKLTQQIDKLSEELVTIKLEKKKIENPDKSYITSINKSTPNNDIEISGNALEFTGDRVNFENQFCVGNFCLTGEDLEKISNDTCGPQGIPGICGDAII